MRPIHRTRSHWRALTVFAVLASASLLVLVCHPGSNQVSAQVYSNEVGFIKADTVDDGATLVSVPLVLLGEDPHYGLNNETLDGPGEIGLMLAHDLVGGTAFADADKVMFFEGTGYRTAWLYYNSGNPSDPSNNVWFEGLAVSDLTLEPHQGFWIVRTNAGDPDEVTLLGAVRTDDPVQITFDTGWSMFSWPYPKDHDLQSSTLYADGAYAAAQEEDADQVVTHDPTSGYETHWLSTDGTWYFGLVLSTLTFQPETGYWYYRQPAAGGPFTWDCAKPY
jgi:hypothetical protein